MSILDQLKQSLGPDVVQQISAKLGTDPGTANNALGAALPVLIGALANNASTPAGAEALNTALVNDHDGSALDDVAGMVNSLHGGGIGAKILGHVLGGRQGPIANGVAQATGLNASKVTSLLVMLAPLVLAALGKARRNGNLDAGGLAGMLGHERARIDNSGGHLGGLMGMLDANHDGSVNAADVMGMASKFMKGH